MFKSFSVNSKPVSLGNPQIQPNVTDISKSLKLAITPSTTVSSMVPPHQASISAVGINHTTFDISTSVKQSLQTVVTSLVSNNKFILPPLSTAKNINQIVPTYSLKTQIGKLSKNNDFTISNHTYEPYELLTGVSHERPEIVMLTNFMPLFISENNSSIPSTS